MTPDRTERAGSKRRSRIRRVGAGVVAAILVLVVLASGLAGLRVADVAWSAHDEAALAADALLRYRIGGRDDPGASSTAGTQDDLLTVALLGLAHAQDASRPAQDRLQEARRHLSLVEAHRAPSAGAADAPAGGASVAGWRLLLAVEVARLSGEPADRGRVRVQADEVLAALRSSRIGVLGASAEGGARMSDTVVAAAGLRQADRSVGVPGASEALAVWLRQVEPLRDGGSKLLPARVDVSGRVLEGVRASSQAVIQVFWPLLDPATSSRDWAAFENIFLCPRLGLIVVCEYPGGGGVADQVSGPLVVGVSASSTLFTLAAARSHGNVDLSRQISREADLFGVGSVASRLEGESGQPPLDVVLAWARTVPVADDVPGVDERAPVPWPALLLVALAPGLLAFSALIWWVVGARAHVSGPLDDDAEPPLSPGVPRR